MGILDKLLRRKPKIKSFGVEGAGIIPVEVDYETSYKINPWVYRCVRVIGNKVASTPIKIYKETSKGSEEVPDIKIQIFKRPNRFISWTELLRKTVAWIHLHGTSYWWVIRDSNGKPLELYLLRTSLVRYDTDPVNLYKKFYYRVGGDVGEIEIDPKDVLVFRNTNPFSEREGLSTISAIKKTIETDEAIRLLNKSLLDNGAVPNGILWTEQNLSDDEVQRNLAIWNATHKGVKNAGKVALLTGGLQYQQVGLKPEDAKFLEQRKLNRTEIGAVFGVPPVFLGDYQYSNYKVEDQRKSFYIDTVIPQARDIEDVINAFLMPMFGNEYWMEFDFTSLPEFQEDEQKKANVAKIYVSSGIKTINEVREEMGLPKVPWGDSWWAPMSLVSFGEYKEGKKVDEAITKLFPSIKFNRELYWKSFVQKVSPQERKFTSELRKYFEKQAKEIIKNLEGNKSIKKGLVDDIFDFSKWVKIFKQKFSPLLLAFFMQAGEDQADLWRLSISFDVLNERAIKYVGDKIDFISAKINETTKEKLRKTLQEGVQNGEGVPELSKRIRNLFNDFSKTRAETIARTEVISANNAGSLESYKLGGVEKKEWITALDERTREWHVEADGQIVGIDEPFLVGGEELMYPGDPSGSPENTINCRCTIAPYFD